MGIDPKLLPKRVQEIYRKAASAPRMPVKRAWMPQEPRTPVETTQESKRRAAPKQRESDLVRACLELLHARGIMAWRNNTGAFVGEHRGKSRFVRFGAKGSGDIFAILLGGRFWSIECKVGKNQATPAQTEWAEAVRKAGGAATVIRNLDELMTDLDILTHLFCVDLG